jgi:hypothetical protein
MGCHAQRTAALYSDKSKTDTRHLGRVTKRDRTRQGPQTHEGFPAMLKEIPGWGEGGWGIEVRGVWIDKQGKVGLPAG